MHFTYVHHKVIASDFSPGGPKVSGSRSNASNCPGSFHAGDQTHLIQWPSLWQQNSPGDRDSRCRRASYVRSCLIQREMSLDLSDVMSARPKRLHPGDQTYPEGTGWSRSAGGWRQGVPLRWPAAPERTWTRPARRWGRRRGVEVKVHLPAARLSHRR